MMMESIMNNRLNKKFEVISPNQFGFRSHVPAEDAVVGLNQFSNKKCVLVFFSTKAYDSVSIPILLKKLENNWFP